MKIAFLTLKRLVLAAALVAAGSIAEAAPKRAVAVERAPAVIAEEAADESINAKLVVDSKAPALPVAQTATTEAANPVSAPAEASVALAEAPKAELPKIDTTKAPETEIPVLATPKTDKKAAGSPFARIMATIGILCVVFGGLSFALRRWMKKGGPKKETTKIKILTQHALGPKKSLAIVQVAGESILIGITDQNISMLKTLSLIDDEIPEQLPRDFGNAIDEFEDEAPQKQQRRLPAVQAPRETEDFAMRGISEIRDVVSSRLRNMKNF